MKRLLIAAAVATLSACVGKEGPMGPEGPPGLDGPGTHLVFAATVDATGTASAELPLDAGSSVDYPPVLTCYLAQTPSSTAWLAVGDGDSTAGAYCGLVFSGGGFTAVMSQAPVGWSAEFVIVY